MSSRVPAALVNALADRYRVERELGAGGMATVYLAEDLKHDRKVAIKVLRPELAAVIGAERFLREIKTIANLSHPHILGLIDSGEVNGTAYYVMPFVEGESLRDRLMREKQLPIADAVRLATEVAGALDYAHRHGVIHRDIKPENILLHDGRALVADFGIALAASKSGGVRMTETGMSLGTPTYMSPEQAMGEREITARSDVYALACVTYEMLVGDPPFIGSTAQAIVAKVMTEKPAPPSRIRDTVTEAIDDAVLTGLAKLPADRFGTAAEFAAALQRSPRADHRSARGGMAGHRRGLGNAVLYAVLAIVTALAMWGWLRHRSQPAASGMIRATIQLGDSTQIRPIGNLRLALSPNGRSIAFVGVDGNDDALFIREMGKEKVRKLADTRGAFAPFFSPDSRRLGFFTGAAGRSTMRTVSVEGGTVTTIAVDSLASFGGASWADDGYIYFTHSSRALARIPAKGGTITIIASPDSSTGVKEYDYPDVLPGSKQALLMLWKGSLGTNRVGIIDLKTGALTELSGGSYPRFVAPSAIAIAGGAGRIMVARMDPAARKLLDVPTTIIEDAELDLSNGTVQFAVAGNGTLVYQRRGAQGSGVVYVERDGKRAPVDTTLKGIYQSLALSPDGQQLALSLSVAEGIEIWLKQLSTGTYVRISGDLVDADRPVWTPDGREIAFLATSSTGRTAFIRRADGSDSIRRVSQGSFDEIAFDRTMRYTIFRTIGSAIGTRSLMVRQTGVDSTPRSLLSARFDHAAMALSPDGKWLAFVSDESGAKEVYVRPFPDVQSAKYPISALGGIEPVWSRDGKELFFRSPAGGAMFSVAVSGGVEFAHGPPRRLFDAPEMIMQEFYRSYDVTPDGRRFIMLSAGRAESGSLQAMFNWQVPEPGQ